MGDVVYGKFNGRSSVGLISSNELDEIEITIERAMHILAIKLHRLNLNTDSPTFQRAYSLAVEDITQAAVRLLLDQKIDR